MPAARRSIRCMTSARRPLIGITTDCNPQRTRYSSPFGYAASVQKAGGLPLLLPYRIDLSIAPQIAAELDGIVFSGGDDLDPVSYGQAFHPEAEPIDPERERFERALLAEVERRRLPTLGICLGSQLMNVHRGGSLHQFLPDLEPRADHAIEHRRLGDWGRRHEVTLLNDAPLTCRMGSRQVVVNTSHKQAVNRLGRGLRVIATAPDGVIEGIDDPSLPLFLGVQWHPERICEQPEHLAIFRLLVETAASCA
jgi:putative glutamine amidotransferase